MFRCLLCKSTKDDPVKYGPIMKKDGLTVHMNCVYLTSNLVQTNSETEGILGFETKAIRAEANKMQKYICCFCKRNNANIGCCKAKCHRLFHTTCGVENNVQFQFCKTFNSHCNIHARKVKYRPQKSEVCCICYDNLINNGESFNAMRFLRAPCCQNGWFHKYCLQKYANISGYFFKCPLCNDFEQFRKELPFWGIFIQDRDAEWELDHNAFAELTNRPQKCTADVCKNVRGREEQSDDNPYVYCNACGAVAIHEKCKKKGIFHCNDCLNIVRNGNENNVPNLNEDSLVDVEGLTEDDSDDNDEHINVETNVNFSIEVNCEQSMSSAPINHSPDSGNSSETLKRISESEDSPCGLINTNWYWSQRKKRKVNKIYSDDDSSVERKPVERRKSKRLRKTSSSSSSGGTSSSFTLNKPNIKRKLTTHILSSNNSSDSDDPLCCDDAFAKLSDLKNEATKSEIISEPKDHSKIVKKAKIILEKDSAYDLNHDTSIEGLSCIANRTRRKSQSTDTSESSSPVPHWRSSSRRSNVLSTTDEE